MIEPFQEPIVGPLFLICKWIKGSQLETNVNLERSGVKPNVTRIEQSAVSFREMLCLLATFPSECQRVEMMFVNDLITIYSDKYHMEPM